MVDASSIGNGGFSPYQKALTRLQADAPPMHPALVKEVLEADLDRATEQVFAEFTAHRMAAASIGQVHRAVLTTVARLQSKFNIRVPRRQSVTTWPTPNYWQRSSGSP